MYNGDTKDVCPDCAISIKRKLGIHPSRFVVQSSRITLDLEDSSRDMVVTLRYILMIFIKTIYFPIVIFQGSIKLYISSHQLGRLSYIQLGVILSVLVF